MNEPPNIAGGHPLKAGPEWFPILPAGQNILSQLQLTKLEFSTWAVSYPSRMKARTACDREGKNPDAVTVSSLVNSLEVSRSPTNSPFLGVRFVRLGLLIFVLIGQISFLAR